MAKQQRAADDIKAPSLEVLCMKELTKDLLDNLTRIYNFWRFRLIPTRIFLKRKFKKKLGYPLNLKAPRSMNEKLQWLKLYDRSELHTQCADKVRVRQHIAERLGEEYLVPCVLTTTSPKDICKENLPDYPVIVKTNHDSGSNWVIKDKNKFDFQGLQKKLKRSMKNNHYWRTREWQYKNIQPQIIVEKLLIDELGEIPRDYKLHCLNGKATIIQVDYDRRTGHKRNLYTPDWQVIDARRSSYGQVTPEGKPKNLEKMISLAEMVAADFDFVRVDFYLIDNKIFFGEMTFRPASGWAKYSPQSYDFEFGEKLKLTAFTNPSRHSEEHV